GNFDTERQSHRRRSRARPPRLGSVARAPARAARAGAYCPDGGWGALPRCASRWGSLASSSSGGAPPAHHVPQRALERARLPGACAGVLDQRDEALAKFFAEFHAPLIERVVTPDDALHEHCMLVEGDESSEHAWVEPLEHHEAHRAVALVHFVRDQRRDAFLGQALLLQ